MCRLWVSFIVTAFAAGVLNLITIAYFRYDNIVNPFRLQSEKQIKLVVMLVYLFSVFSAIPDFLVMKKEGSTCSPQFDEPLYLLLYQAFVLLLIFVFPTMVLSVFYFKLSIYLWRHDKYILNQCHRGQQFSSEKIHPPKVKYLRHICTFIISFIAVLIYIHLLLFITRKYTIIDANLKLINAKIHSFYSIDTH